MKLSDRNIAGLWLLAVLIAFGLGVILLIPTPPPPANPLPAKEWWACTNQIVRSNTPPPCLTDPNRQP